MLGHCLIFLIEKAKKIAEPLRKKIAETKIPAASKEIEDGYESYRKQGIAQLSKKGTSHMLHLADMALYKAKALSNKLLLLKNENSIRNQKQTYISL